MKLCFKNYFAFACPAGFEPATYSLEGCCSIQLSYGHLIFLFCLQLRSPPIWRIYLPQGAKRLVAGSYGHLIFLFCLQLRSPPIWRIYLPQGAKRLVAGSYLPHRSFSKNGWILDKQKLPNIGNKYNITKK